MSIFAKAQKSFIAAFIRKIFKIEIINPENEPDFGAYITCANHSSNWDPIILGACMHRPLRYMAKAELFKVPILKNIIKWFGAYPVDRKRADVSSIRMTVNILEQGEIIGMFAQGSRAKGVHPKEVEPKHGVAMIAVKAGSGILPVTIISKRYKVRLFCRTIVIFGKYMTHEELVSESGDKTGENKIGENMSLYKEIMNKVYGEILENYERYDDINKK